MVDKIKKHYYWPYYYKEAEQKQYGIAGLQDVTMLQTLSMDIQPGEFVQILNVANSHWVIDHIYNWM